MVITILIGICKATNMTTFRRFAHLEAPSASVTGVALSPDGADFQAVFVRRLVMLSEYTVAKKRVDI
jgi:hypothetical protein